MREHQSCVPPAVLSHVAESPINHTGNELATSDKKGIDSDQLTSQVRRGNFCDVHRNSHGSNA